jgi:hypothetical protein
MKTELLYTLNRLSHLSHSLFTTHNCEQSHMPGLLFPLYTGGDLGRMVQNTVLPTEQSKGSVHKEFHLDLCDEGSRLISYFVLFCFVFPNQTYSDL